MGERILKEMTKRYILKNSTGDDIITVTGNIGIKILASLNIDVLKIVYQPLGLTKENYEEDLEKKINLFVINNKGRTTYVPEYMLVEKVDETLFSRKLLGINLGFVPTNLDTVNLLSIIAESIENELGITAEVTVIDTLEKYLPKEQEILFYSSLPLIKEESTMSRLDKVTRTLTNCIRDKTALLEQLRKIKK